MDNTDSRRVLSRLPDDQFFDRGAELARILAVATAGFPHAHDLRGSDERPVARGPRAANLVVLGAPRVGKTELLRKGFDRLFNEGTDVAPIFFTLNRFGVPASRFARDYLTQFLVQFIAFRRGDPGLLGAADESLESIARASSPEDYLWVRSLVDTFARAEQVGEPLHLVRSALSAPLVAAARTGIAPFVIIDNFHLLAVAPSGPAGGEAAAEAAPDLRVEILRALTAQAKAGSSADPHVFPRYAFCGLRRVILELIPPEGELFDRLELLRVGPMGEDSLERMTRSMAAELKIEISDSTVELMIHQLNRDPFYIRAILNAAAARAGNLRTFIEFERVYTEEVLGGRVCHYTSAVLRDLAPDSRSRRAALEALALAVGADAALPVESVLERIQDFAPDAERLLAQLHARELIEISYGFVTAPQDPVLADYVRATYRKEIAGARRPLAGEELLGEKLKDSYRLMMSRYNRAVESQLVELLSRFDFQAVPTSLFDVATFDKRYRGMSRVQVRRALDEEQERTRLPQIVLVEDLTAVEQPGVSWRLFAARGFEGGIYSEANESLWLIALVNSKEPLDLESLGRLDQRFESAARGARERSGHYSRLVRWYISKEGFSAATDERLAAARAYRSTYAQLDLLHDYVTKLGAAEALRPASEFELVIPIEDDAELIAARTVEQIARAADFEPEAINQIKTALIEACLNAAEHGDSPDRKIYQRFALDNDRLIITVANKGKAFSSANGEAAPAGLSLKGTRGRGLQIIRALMDEVKFERTDDGATLVMTKYLKPPEK